MPSRPRRPVIIEDETIAHSRALTDSTKRITLAASGLSFRSYNELYEKWLKNRYRDDIKPFTTHSPHVYDPYITEHGLSMVLDMDRATTSLAEELERDANEEGFLQAFVQIWREMGKRKREEMVLTVWEDQCRRAEKGEYIWAREDTPELTLSWATGDAQDGTPNWIKLWLNQAQTEEEKRRSRRDKDALPYLNLRNDKWDRVNGVFEIEKSLVPVRKSIRAFVHDGVARRNYHLRQFVQELFCVLAEIDMVSAPEEQPQIRADAEGEADMLAQLQSEGVSIGSKPRREYVVCAGCRAGGNVKPVKLKCSNCLTKMNRTVRYCSSACQLRHWKAGHRQVCGKPLTDSLSVPSLAPSNLSSSGTSLKSTSDPELSAEFDNLAISSKVPRTRLRAMTYNTILTSEVAFWVQFQGHPDAFDPRKPLDAVPLDVPLKAKSRRVLRPVLRSIALKFLLDETGDEELLNLGVVVLSVSGRLSKAEPKQTRWFAKLIGREGRELDEFVDNEYQTRLEKGLELVKSREEYRAIREYFDDKESDATGPKRPITIPMQTRDDLDNDLEAFWYTSHPAHPHLSILQSCMRVGGPIIDETSDSKFSKEGNKLILVEALRAEAYRVLEDPVENAESLGILLLALTVGAGPRSRKWWIWRTSKDLGIPEKTIEEAMEIIKPQIDGGGGKEIGDMHREAFRLLSEDPVNEDMFPPLSFYSDPASTDSRALQSSSTSSATAVNGETASSKKKKKNKKKKNKKKGKKETTERESS